MSSKTLPINLGKNQSKTGKKNAKQDAQDKLYRLKGVGLLAVFSLEMASNEKFPL